MLENKELDEEKQFPVFIQEDALLSQGFLSPVAGRRLYKQTLRGGCIQLEPLESHIPFFFS